MPARITLTELVGEYAVSRLEQGAAFPAWADGKGFVSISRTSDELSIVCLAERVPDGVKSDAGWIVFKFEGPFGFDQTGIATSVLNPLAEEKIGIFLISTFDTDYLLIKTENRRKAISALEKAGHQLNSA
jgi:uncharacterized protein